MALPTYTIVEYSLLTPPPPSFSFNISAPQSQLSLPSAPTALANANNIFISGIVDVNQVRAVDTFQNRGTTGFEQLNGAPADLLTLNTTSSIGTIKAAPQSDIGWIPATVAQATQLFTWQKLVQLAVSDTVANLLTFNTTRTVTGPIEATTNATVNQAYQLLAWSKPVLFNIEDTVANVLTFNTTKTVLGDIIATGGANVSATQQFATWGKTPLFDTVDTVANIVAALPASLSAFNKAQAVEATGVATVAQANSIYTIEPQGDGVNVAIQGIAGTSAELASLQFGANDYAQTLTASNAANVAQATTIQGFYMSGNAGVTVYSITDLASVVATATPEVLGTAQDIIANGPAIDAAEAQVILGALNNGTTLISAVTDTAAEIVNLNFDANDTIISVVVSGTAGVGQADVILGDVTLGFIETVTYSLEDTITLLNGATNATLNGAVNITGTGIGTVTEANRVLAATNSGLTYLNQVSGTSANVATLAVGLNDSIGTIVTTDTATAAQATAIATIATAAETTTLQIQNITDGFLAVQNMASSAAGQAALAAVQTATIANGTSAADTIQFGNFTAGLVPDGLVINGLGGNDSITGSQGNDSVTGGTGADVIGLLVAGGTDTVTQGATDSVASTTGWRNGLNPSNTLAADNVITFGNGVDVVTEFVAGLGGDVLVINVAARPQLALGLDPTTNFTNSTSAYYLSGTYTALSGQFVVSLDGAGPDTLIAQSVTGFDFNDSTSYVVLRGVDSDNLVAENFGGSPATPLSASIASGNATLTIVGASTGAVVVTPGAAPTPGLVITQGGTAVTVGGPGSYVPASLTTINAGAALNNGHPFTFNINYANTANLSSVTGSQASDLFVYATSGHGFGAGAAVTGGTGNDTLRFTAAIENATVFGAAGANNYLINNIENITLVGGIGGGNTASIDNSVTTAVAVTNATGTATFTLGTGAAHTYNAAGVTGVQNITVGNAGSSVTTGISNDIVNIATGSKTLTGAFNGGLGDNSLVWAGGAAQNLTLTGATLSNLGTFQVTGGNNSTTVMNEANIAVLSNITGGATSSLTLSSSASGNYDFTSKALSGFTGTLALVGSSTLVVDNADTAQFTVINGDSNPATNTLSYTTGTTAPVVLSGGGLNVTNIDSVIISGSDRTLSVNGNDFDANTYTTLTGSAGNNNLTIAGATVANLTNAVITGFDAVNASAMLGFALTINAQTFVGNVVITGDTTGDLVIARVGSGNTSAVLTNITLAANTYDIIELGRSANALETTNVVVDNGFFTNTVGQTVRSVAGAGVDPTVTINMDQIALNLGNVTIGAAAGTEVDFVINGTTGNNTITAALTKLAGSSFSITGGEGTDLYRVGQSSGNLLAVGTATQNLTVADAVRVNGFNAAGSEQVQIKQSDLVGAANAVASVASGSMNIDTAGFTFINNASVGDFTSLNNFASAVGVYAGGVANDKFFVAVKNIAGTEIGIYSVQERGAGAALTTIDSTDAVALVGVLDVTAGTFGLTNMATY